VRRRAALLGTVLLTVSIGSVSGQQAASAFVGTARPDDTGDLVGLYEGPRGFISVSPLGGGATQLLLADAASDELRMLFPVASDSFVAGPEIARREPVQLIVRLRRSSSGRIDALVLHRADDGPDEVARRVALRAVPVAFTSDSVRLVGTLLLPPSSRRGPFPAVVLAHGSEASDRHSFGPVPYVLAGHGFAVLAFDKRGTGASSGSWRDVGLEPLADDVASAVRLLAGRAEVDARRIGIVGFSEGGWVAPLAASRTPLVKFIVTISGGGLTKGDAYVHKARRLAEEAGLTGRALDSAVAVAETTIAESRDRVRAAHSPSGFDRRVAYDPAADWRRVRGPVLVMAGADDVLEPAVRSSAWVERTLRQAGNLDVTVKLFPRAHHSLLLGVTGTPSEFATMRGISQLAPGYWEVLVGWLGRASRPRTTGH
jgi:dipeptidyl aminopeptidase/acylaminoacyl peptidase